MGMRIVFGKIVQLVIGGLVGCILGGIITGNENYWIALAVGLPLLFTVARHLRRRRASSARAAASRCCGRASSRRSPACGRRR